AALGHITFFAIIMATPLRLVDELGAGEAFMAMFGMAELMAGALAAMLTERLLRRLGLRLFMALSVSGTALAALIIGLSPILELTLLGAFISGATWTAATIAMYVFLVERIPQREATASSVAYQQVIALSVFVGPLLGGLLMSNIPSLVIILLLGAALRLMAGIFTYYNPVDMAEAAIRVTQTMLPVTEPSDALDGNGRRGGWAGRRRLRRVRVWSGRWRR
ncbi:MAG: MFS transporter, partial [Phototrophicaceae bacterium]